jgi:hypothetical protein
MAWSVCDWRLGRGAVRLVALPLLWVARLGLWAGEQVIRLALWLGVDRRELDRLPPDVRERLGG